MSRQTEYNKRWQKKNPERARYLRRRSTARSFLRHDATVSDLDELAAIAQERRDSLERKV